MPISDEDVLKIARLARLALSPAEVSLYGTQLKAVLDHISELEAVDTSAVEPTAHALGLVNALREDAPRVSADREAVLEQAPEREGPYFKVPKVIE